MLIVNYVINTFYRIEKTEILKTSMTSSVRSTIEKNGRRENIFQNKYLLVPKTCAKVARYVVRRQLISYLHRHVANAPSDQGNIQLYRKIP